MDFNTLDKQMRRFEQSMDRPLLEEINVVARLDGHGFTRLTKKEWDPLWQKRGIGMYFRDEQRQGVNPITQETTSCVRHALHVEMELPIGQEYSQLINKIINEQNK